ncbi:MAG: DUF5013 domain-containing protein [Bacteroidaceae bacterium]|nr:DUF5013 domain-containing protein [Bacteroidaceae bacterium]
MRNRLLTMFAMALVAIGINAQDLEWAEPVQPDRATVAPSDPVSGHIYEIRNVESQRYVAGTQVWFGWNTTAALVDPEELEPIRFTATEEITETTDPETNETVETSKGWTFKGYDGSWPNNYIFVSGNGGQGSLPNDPDNVGFAMHVDNPTDVHRYFELVKQEDGKYRIRVAADDATYGSVLEGWEGRFWGWNPEEEHANNFHACVYPEKGYECDFEFIDWTIYFLQVDLYTLYMTIQEEELDVELTPYTAIYNGTDVEAMREAVEALTDATRKARVAKVLEGASKENPADGTSLLVNPAFDQGTQWSQPPGWTVEAMGGNNGWQNNNIFNGNNGAFLNQFMESWKGDALKDGGMYQVVKDLPAGEYTLECDAMTNRDFAGANVTGVELFATGGTITTTTPVATASNVPDHFTLRFVSAGGDMTLGLRTRSTNTNWICADNFKLWYYGDTGNPYKLALDNAIEEAEATYKLDDVYAYKDSKQYYSDVLNYVKGISAAEAQEDEDYIDARDTLNIAIDSLRAAIAIYDDFQTFINDWNDKNTTMSDPNYAEGKWASAFGDALEALGDQSISDRLYALQQSHDNCEITEEDILKEEDAISAAFAEYVSEHVDKGDDLSFMLVNPGFDDKNPNGSYKGFYGWDVNEGTEEDAMVTPAWGGEDPSYVDPETGETVTAEGGNAEVYRAKFEISQTIKNMPAGLFTLSCQAFERDDNGQGVDAELFAILGDGTVQAVKIKNLLDDGSETQLYDGQTGGGGRNPDKLTNGLWRPDGMCSANVHFAVGEYRNRFNILLEERSDLTIGIRDLSGGNTWGSSGDWVLFDDFKIVYKGEDATAYVDAIQELIDELEKMEENGAVYTEETKTEVSEAIGTGSDLIENAEDETVENARAAITALEEAIAHGKAVSARFREVQREFIIHQQYRYDMVENAPDTEDLLTWMDDYSSYFGDSFDAIPDDLFETDEDLEAFLPELRTRFTAFAFEAAEVTLEEGVTVSENNPIDVTAVIYNPDCMGYYRGEDGSPVGAEGWTLSKGAIGTGGNDAANLEFGANSMIEFFDQKEYEISQTIYGLKPGFYRLELPGFYRNGLAADIEKSLAGEVSVGQLKLARLFADEAETAMLLVFDPESMAAFNEMVTTEGNTDACKELKVNGDEGETTYYIPDGISKAEKAFNNGLYKNILQFEVAEGQETVTIGLRKIPFEDTEDITLANDWTVWGNWSLFYLGTVEPLEDPTTAIQKVENAEPAQATVIYNIAGQRVQKALKGVYIVNGRKVVVK